MRTYDVVIIGGGINGCGCAADAALRGLSVLLCEKDDLASKTSSNSTKLIHGGLRYLEHCDFTLVKKALDERQKLLELAPHLVYPLAIVLPHQKNMRPRWVLRTGLFLYDHLSRKNKLPKTKTLSARLNPDYFAPLAANLKNGFMFYDCRTDDMRLTLANAKQAKEHGAEIRPNTAFVHAEVTDEQWLLTFQPKAGALFQVKAKAVINAAGPWVDKVGELFHTPLNRTMTLVKGSHLVVHKLYEGEQAYLLQHEDKRVVFVIPYHGYTMIGTTDVDFKGPLDNINIDPNETNYLCALVNQHFKKQIDARDIISSWSGIRPLLAEEGKALKSISRDYAYQFLSKPAPSITIYGGKITTYRKLAESAINQLRSVFPNLPASSTATTPLPGATLDTMNFAAYKKYARSKYFWLNEETLERYLSSYGTETERVLAGHKSMPDLGICFTETLYQNEVDFLLDEEWAGNCEDILWRRTKLGLTTDAVHQKALAEYIFERV